MCSRRQSWATRPGARGRWIRACTVGATSTTTTLVPSAAIDRVRQAEDDLARTARQITDETPLAQAGAAYNSAALALEVAWLRLLDEATARALRSTLEDVAQQEEMQTTVLQTILTLTGFWDEPIDGQWTPELTQALMNFQTALGVEPTGVVDAATLAAFQQAIAGLEGVLTSTTTSAPAATVPPTGAPTTPTATRPPTDTGTPAPAG
jgi:hypothetical protein